jgi:hypothetical protein
MPGYYHYRAPRNTMQTRRRWRRMMRRGARRIRKDAIWGELMKRRRSTSRS